MVEKIPRVNGEHTNHCTDMISPAPGTFIKAVLLGHTINDTTPSPSSKLDLSREQSHCAGFNYFKSSNLPTLLYPPTPYPPPLQLWRPDRGSSQMQTLLIFPNLEGGKKSTHQHKRNASTAQKISNVLERAIHLCVCLSFMDH